MLGELFGVSQPVANKWIHRLLPIVNRALAALGELPSRQTPQLLIRLGILRLTIKFQIIFFQDSTERPIQRPKDPQRQKAYYSGKKKQHTHKNNLVIEKLCY